MIDLGLPERFESDRLRMRPQAGDDAEALFEGYSDVELMRYWSSAPHGDVDESRDYLTRPNDAPWQGWTMTLAGDDTAIGTLAASRRREGVWEIGYLLIRRHWGRGLAREGVTRLIDLLFADPATRRIMADTDPDNGASNALLTALGFTCEGRLRGEWETHIGVRDSFIWGLLRDEWRA